MTEFLEPALFQSIIPIQAFQWISIACQKSQECVTHFYERKKHH